MRTKGIYVKSIQMHQIPANAVPPPDDDQCDFVAWERCGRRGRRPLHARARMLPGIFGRRGSAALPTLSK